MPLARRVRFDLFELDTQTGEIWKSGEQIHLQEKPFEVLTVLLESAGDVVTRAELQKRVWPDQAYLDFDHCINVAVSKLRESLGDSAESPILIETMPCRGYRFIAPLDVGPTNGAPPRSPWPWLGGAAVGLVLLIGFGLVGLVRSGRFSPDEAQIEAESVEPTESVAVLPFLNISGNPSQVYIAEGISESIISELGDMGSLRVISWQSVLQFKGSSESLPSIAHLLDVDALVLGSVRVTEEKILIRTQLVRVDPERHVWAKTYDNPLEDLMAIEQRVAQTIAGEIAFTLTTRARDLLARPEAVVPAAHDAYLKGLHAWNQFTKPGFESAIEQFEHAITLDPAFAAAHAGLADAWTMLAWYGFAAPHTAFPQAESAAKRALELDPHSARAHNSMAAVLDSYRWEFSEAKGHHLRAIDLNPGFALARGWYSWALAQEGSFEEALEEAREAQRLDPMSAAMNATLGARLYDARRYDQAIDQLRLTLEMHQTFFPAILFLGMTYQRIGLHDEAIAVLQDGVTLSGGAPVFEAARAAALAGAGRTREAESALAAVLLAPEQRDSAAVQIAIAFISLGDHDRALEWLEKACEDRLPMIGRIAIEPLLDPLRDDPRFQELQRAVGL